MSSFGFELTKKQKRDLKITPNTKSFLPTCMPDLRSGGLNAVQLKQVFSEKLNFEWIKPSKKPWRKPFTGNIASSVPVTTENLFLGTAPSIETRRLAFGAVEPNDTQLASSAASATGCSFRTYSPVNRTICEASNLPPVFPGGKRAEYYNWNSTTSSVSSTSPSTGLSPTQKPLLSSVENSEIQLQLPTFTNATPTVGYKNADSCFSFEAGTTNTASKGGSFAFGAQNTAAIASAGSSFDTSVLTTTSSDLSFGMPAASKPPPPPDNTSLPLGATATMASSGFTLGHPDTITTSSGFAFGSSVLSNSTGFTFGAMPNIQTGRTAFGMSTPANAGFSFHTTPTVSTTTFSLGVTPLATSVASLEGFGFGSAGARSAASQFPFTCISGTPSFGCFGVPATITTAPSSALTAPVGFTSGNSGIQMPVSTNSTLTFGSNDAATATTASTVFSLESVTSTTPSIAPSIFDASKSATSWKEWFIRWFSFPSVYAKETENPTTNKDVLPDVTQGENDSATASITSSLPSSDLCLVEKPDTTSLENCEIQFQLPKPTNTTLPYGNSSPIYTARQLKISFMVQSEIMDVTKLLCNIYGDKKVQQIGQEHSPEMLKSDSSKNVETHPSGRDSFHFSNELQDNNTCLDSDNIRTVINKKLLSEVKELCRDLKDSVEQMECTEKTDSDLQNFSESTNEMNIDENNSNMCGKIFNEITGFEMLHAHSSSENFQPKVQNISNTVLKDDEQGNSAESNDYTSQELDPQEELHSSKMDVDEKFNFSRYLPCISINSQIISPSGSADITINFDSQGILLQLPKFKKSCKTVLVLLSKSFVEHVCVHHDKASEFIVSITTSSNSQFLKEYLTFRRVCSSHFIPDQEELTSDMEKAVSEALENATAGDKLCKISSHVLILEDIGTLKELEWLNDSVINAYMQLIVERSKKDNYCSAYAFSTFFFPKYVNAGFNSVQRWTKLIDIFQFELNFIPLHRNYHWSLIVIDHRFQKICYFDSMNFCGEGCLQLIHEYLSLEYKAKKGEDLNPCTYKTKSIKDAPQQENKFDCGVFVLKYAEYLARDAEINFKQADMTYFRKQIMYELVKAHLL